eukprot:GILI01020700.1.p1 GENE.GILI01020700.1~~GILI01020700.1.p1  ORF type:complete len:340 (+),score=89.18 GILI01020700.1:53-1072(+)
MRVLFLAAFFFSAVLLLVAQTAQAWWCVGHMTVAKIAQTQMQPATIAYVNSVIQTLSAAGPFKESPDMVQAACWADDLKTMDIKEMASWHFIDQPYAPNNFPVPGQPVQDENVAKAIDQLYLGSKTNKENPTGWAMGFNLANMIHFVGDIHQPLHATELFSTIYPTGDAGGNAETVFVDGATTNLHAVWDSICWTWNTDLVRPLSASDLTKLDTYSSGLLAKYTFTDDQIGVYDPYTMANESFSIAVSTAYNGIVNNTVITQPYLAACLPAAEQRVALGGLRLGKQLQYLLGSFAEKRAANAEKGVLDMHLEEVILNKTKDFFHGLRSKYHGIKQHIKK